ncbi:hypothetical protein GCM10023196_044380 [Actinoallomurus vinaceus]|uniref:Uncharacterized protein n=1 Tax=Actinoallomurus vinaceus TaxID=1080074 RepID=A0ABP8UD76_9ACTN
MNEVPSFEEFVSSRADALMRYAYVLTGDPHDAADLLQESLARMRAAWAGDNAEAEIWAAPADGRAAHRVADLPGKNTQLTRLVIDGNDAVWSVEGTGGVYRAPLTGGTPQAVPGSAGTHILDWPWIGGPYSLEGPVSDHAVTFEHLLNARTGQKRSADLTDHDGWECGVTWCTGDGPAGASEVQRRDGGGRHAIPNGLAGVVEQVPMLDRFVLINPSLSLKPGPHAYGKTALYDLETGRMGDLGVDAVNDDGFGPGSQNPANRLGFVKNGDDYLIVDMGAIS